MDNVIDDSSVTPEIELSPSPQIPESDSHLTSKQQKFVDAYIKTNDATQSAISAGYALKSAYVEGSRLLRNVKILAELKHWKSNKREQLTRNDFVDLALEDYKQLDIEQPNKPRFLDIAGKALGYLGANGTPTSVINNTQVNIGEMKLIATPDKWKMLRDALEHE